MVIKHPPPNPERDKHIYDMWNNRVSVDQIGKRYSLSGTRIRQIVRREQLRRGEKT